MATPTLTSRYTIIDQGERIDMFQIVGQGGNVLSGETWNGLFYGQSMAQDSVTAHAGGGQANAFVMTGVYLRVTTVATAGDSVVLPPAVRGMTLTVVNDDPTVGGKSMNIFPASFAQGGVAGGDAINALGANAAFALNNTFASVSPGIVTIFYCFSNGFWRTK
jgi:hypothetical protein